MSRPLVTRIPARQWLMVLLGGVACLALWQVWLTVRLLDQDQSLELQRSRERLEGIGNETASRLAMRLHEWTETIETLNESTIPFSSLFSFAKGGLEAGGVPGTNTFAMFPEGTMAIEITKNSVVAFPSRALLFVPFPPSTSPWRPNVFDRADELEHREHDYQGAIAALQPLAAARVSRPESLMRIARLERKAGNPDLALKTYKGLEKEQGFNSSGTPYALAATLAKCRLLIDLGKPVEARNQAEAAREDLFRGRWPLGRETFDYYASELTKLGASASPPPHRDLVLSELVSRLYSEWRSPEPSPVKSNWNRFLPDSTLVMSTASHIRLIAILLPPNWLASYLSMPPNYSYVRWRLLQEYEIGEPGLPAVTHSLTGLGFPGCRLEFLLVQPSSGPASSRRTLLIAGASLTLIVILGSGYVALRATNRELRLARLQSDFVAAVSHEFRSPLTTLRIITELLAQNRISDESRRRQSYVFLDHETNRLHRLVEDLLDFGRMESGRKQYRVEPHDAFDLVRATVTDFAEHAEAQGFRVEADLVTLEGASAPTIRVDEEAFRRAVRNLLDNAVKYSPVCRTVWVDGTICDRRVLISVRDQGMGINAEEKPAIFQQFVRGEAAKKAGIKGTGIGLAMVRQISEAMGGEIRVQSEVGVGSTFTLVLPLAED